MLFKARFHDGLRDGSIDLTFRRWSKPQAKTGGTYRLIPGPGALMVDSIDKVQVGTITKREAKRAGFDSIDDLKAALHSGGGGGGKGKSITARTSVYRIAFHYEEGSPTEAAGSASTAADIDALVQRLERMDRLSQRGPWTKQTLQLIAKHPQRRAGDLAPMIDRDLRAFKADVRKLKGMGLTTSFEVGYELTTIGRSVLYAR